MVLAAYLHPFQQADTDGAERAFRLSWAAICAAGGTQLVLGENKAALQDSYYANYAALRPSFLPVVQRYCDFLVRYAALLYLDAGMDIGRTAAGGINEDIQFEAENCVFSTDAEADTVWSMIRESGSRLNIQLVNLRGNNARWNEAKAAPKAAENIRIHVRLELQQEEISRAQMITDAVLLQIQISVPDHIQDPFVDAAGKMDPRLVIPDLSQHPHLREQICIVGYQHTSSSIVNQTAAQ